MTLTMTACLDDVDDDVLFSVGRKIRMDVSLNHCDSSQHILVDNVGQSPPPGYNYGSLSRIISIDRRLDFGTGRKRESKSTR